MIVTCVSCQTRFRIPDDKVGPRGARVRCSRCQSLFLVRRDDAPAAPVQLPPPAKPPPEPVPEPSLSTTLSGQPPPPPPSGGLDIDLTSDPFARHPNPARDDPFAPRAEAPGEAPPPDPFAATAAPGDPFSGTTLMFGSPPPGDPFAAAATSDPAGLGLPGTAASPFEALSLEDGERRRRPPPVPSMDHIGQEDLQADFRTPGPSGLEVDEVPEAPAPPAEAPVPPPLPQAAPPAPAARPASVLPPDEPSQATAQAPAVRRALAVLVNSLSLALLLALAAALFVYGKGGGSAALRATLGQREAPFEARDVASGLYDTAAGKPVLFVRGRVLCRNGASGPVRVRVELLEGRRAVARGEGFLGAVPSPEDIWGSGEPAGADRLRASLAARAPARIPPGETRPFLVVLWEHPADLRGLDLRVVAEPASP